jgi:hypothetical protein
MGCVDTVRGVYISMTTVKLSCLGLVAVSSRLGFSDAACLLRVPLPEQQTKEMRINTLVRAGSSKGKRGKRGAPSSRHVEAGTGVVGPPRAM